MPPWGRSSGGLRRAVAGALDGRRMRNGMAEQVDELNGLSRFQLLDSDFDEDADVDAVRAGIVRNGILAAEEERRAIMALAAQQEFSGYPRGVASRRYLGQDDLAYGEDYSQIYEASPQLQLIRQQQSELELAAQAREDEKAVGLALERIRRARARGDSNVDLTPDEIDILRRRGLLPGFESSDPGETTSSGLAMSSSRHRSGSAASVKKTAMSKQMSAAGSNVASSPRGNSKAPKAPNSRVPLPSLSQEVGRTGGPTLIPFPLNAGVRPSTPPNFVSDELSYRQSPRRQHGATSTATSSPVKSVSRRSSRAASLTQRPPSSSAAQYSHYPVDPVYVPEYRPSSATSMFRAAPYEADWIPRTRSSSSVNQPYYYNNSHSNHAHTPPAVGAGVDPFIYQTGQSPSASFSGTAAAAGTGRRYVSGPSGPGGPGGPGPGPGLARTAYPASAMQYASVPRRVPAEFVSSNLRSADNGADGRRQMAADAEIIEISSAEDDDDEDDSEEDELVAAAAARGGVRGMASGARRQYAGGERHEDIPIDEDSESESDSYDSELEQQQQMRQTSARRSAGRGRGGGVAGGASASGAAAAPAAGSSKSSAKTSSSQGRGRGRGRRR